MKHIDMATKLQAGNPVESKQLQEQDRILSADQKQKAIRSFKKFLEQGSYRSTHERFAVLDSILNRVGHFNADELYAEMMTARQNVSRATVYSTLELLAKAGILMKHHFRGERSYYEIGFDEPNHDHLICVNCGHITEFVQPQLLSIRKEAAEGAGLKVVGHSFQIFAECPIPTECPNNTL